MIVEEMVYEAAYKTFVCAPSCCLPRFILLQTMNAKLTLRFINPRWSHREIYEYPPDPLETNPKCIVIDDSITKYVCTLQETKCVFERGADMKVLGAITRLYDRRGILI